MDKFAPEFFERSFVLDSMEVYRRWLPEPKPDPKGIRGVFVKVKRWRRRTWADFTHKLSRTKDVWTGNDYMEYY